MNVIIPQHAHSVRLPRKAFRKICGIPLVAWSVIQAKAAHCVDKVYVSTESDEIADICTPYGAEIIWRPTWLRDKAFAANVPLEHALGVAGLQDLHGPFMCKLATAPLLFPDDIDRLYQKFMASPDIPVGPGKQVILAAPAQEACVYTRIRDPRDCMSMTRYIDKDDNILIPQGALNVMYADAYVPSNRRAEWYLNANAVKDADADVNMVTYQMMLGTAMQYYVPCRKWQTYDIDDEQDLEVCEMFMEHKILKGRGPEVYYEYAEGKSE